VRDPRSGRDHERWRRPERIDRFARYARAVRQHAEQSMLQPPYVRPKARPLAQPGKDSPARSFTTLQARRQHRQRGSCAIDPRVTSAAFARTQKGTRLAARDAEAPEWQITTRGNTRETRKLTRSATPEPSARRATRQPVVAEEGAAAAREARRHPKRRAPHRRAA